MIWFVGLIASLLVAQYSSVAWACSCLLLPAASKSYYSDGSQAAGPA